MIRSRTSFAATAIGVLLFSAVPVFEAAAQVRGAGRTSVNRPHPNAGGHAAARPAPGRDGGGTRDIDRNRNTNRDVNRNVNRNVNRDIDIDIDDHHDWDWDDHRHPVAAGVAFGTAAAVTSAVVGSMIYSLPPACSPYAGSYYYCGGVYYEPRYEGDTVVYVVVDQPR